MSSTFTPPVASTFNPPVDWRDRGMPFRLFRHFASRARAVNVFKLSDGTYVQDNTSDTPVAITGGNVPYPWNPDDPSGPIASWTDATGVMQSQDHASPWIEAVYYGGHSYTVDSTEAAALTAAGYGACLT